MTELKPMFTTRVRNAIADLHPSERRLAETVLNFPGELASYSATELARLAQVSNATVTRFVRKLGYASFEEARRDVRSSREGGASLFRVSPGQGGGGLLAQHIRQAKANLDRTFDAIPEAEIDALAEAILAARMVWLVGTRRSYSFASYLALQIQQAVPVIRLVPSGSETLSEALATVGPDDCAIVFGLRRSVRALPEALRHIGSTGARTAYLYDLDAVPDLALEWRIWCDTASPGPLFNHVGVIALCHVIATSVLHKAGQSGRRRMEAIEALHDRLGEV